MKKIAIVFVMLLSVSLASAKGPKIIGSWMSEKVVVNGTDHQMYMPMIFEEDNDMISNDEVFGVWRYNKKSNALNITSFLNTKFNGDWEIVEASREKLILKMGDIEWHFFKYDETAIATSNASSGLSGDWILESRKALNSDDTEDEELPKITISFKGSNFSIKEESDGYSSSSKGTWIYKPKQNTILFLAGRRDLLVGDAKITKHDENTLSFENKGYTYVFKK